MKKSKRIWTYTLIIIVSFLMLTNSCKKEEQNNNKLPSVVTFTVTNITINSAIVGGSVSIIGIDTIISRGLCWSTNHNPTIADNIMKQGTGSGEFTTNLTGLIANTTYYLRAYANNKAGTTYGREVIIKTFTGTVTDIDGNVYYTVTIGTQIWMVENLKVTKFQNGDPISNVIADSIWWRINTKAYCNYNNDSNNGKIYGHLYNWWVVNDSRKIAPTGWHVPSDGEWTILSNYLGGDSVSGWKLMENGVIHWNSLALGGSNESGFTALPGGYRNSIGGFSDLRNKGNWWSSTNSDEDFTGSFGLRMDDMRLYKNLQTNKLGGASIRCVKD